MILKATKKPVTIECIEWTGDNLKEVLEFTGKSDRFDEWFKSFGDFESHVKSDGNVFKIFTLEGVMSANVGDYIIREVNGENYPCKPDIFHKTYDIDSD